MERYCRSRKDASCWGGGGGMAVEANQKYGGESFTLVFKEIRVLLQLILDGNQLCDNS